MHWSLTDAGHIWSDSLSFLEQSPTLPCSVVAASPVCHWLSVEQVLCPRENVWPNYVNSDSQIWLWSRLVSHLSLSGAPQNGSEVLVMVLPGLPNTRTSLTMATALLRPSYILFELWWNSSCAHLILQDSLSNCYLANMVLNVVNIEDSGFSFMARPLKYLAPASFIAMSTKVGRG